MNIRSKMVKTLVKRSTFVKIFVFLDRNLSVNWSKISASLVNETGRSRLIFPRRCGGWEMGVFPRVLGRRLHWFVHSQSKRHFRCWLNRFLACTLRYFFYFFFMKYFSSWLFHVLLALGSFLSLSLSLLRVLSRQVDIITHDQSHNLESRNNIDLLRRRHTDTSSTISIIHSIYSRIVGKFSDLKKKKKKEEYEIVNLHAVIPS